MSKQSQTDLPDIKRMTRAHLQVFCNSQFKTYLVDPQMNPVLRMMKEIKDLQRQIDEVLQEAAVYEKACEVILKTQESFLQKINLRPKQRTRSLGVNVNIIPKDEEDQTFTGAEPSIPNIPMQTNTITSLTGQSVLKPVKTKEESATLPVTSPVNVSNKSSNQKHNVIDLVDLTLEEDESDRKRFKNNDVGEVQSYKASKVTGTTPTSSQLAKHEDLNYPAMSIVASLPKIQIATPPVHFPCESKFSAGFLEPMKSVPSGIACPQKVLPNLPLGVMHHGTVSSNKSSELLANLPVKDIHPGKAVIFASSSQGHPVPEGRDTSEAFPGTFKLISNHPAPLPEQKAYPKRSLLLEPPPKPSLKIAKEGSNIILSWDMTLTCSYAEIKTYQLYGYDENSGLSDTSVWQEVGKVNALPLPMACTLSQFPGGCCYHFAIRAIDIHSRIGPFSNIVRIPVA